MLIKLPGTQNRRLINRDGLKPFVHRNLGENNRLLTKFTGKDAETIGDNWEEYEVEEVCAKREMRRGREFLLKYKNYEEKEWTPETEMDCPDLVEQFQARVGRGQSAQGPQ
uniref:Chromo domain-containing protein n=1 Tax=Chromera velia CCMP2878 TaxID=1169474 RepID=A0A0G4HRG3_9ALVE|eukprot:Cvel_30577.t1-p1 / transcript=Cvel_30577.t1 / gene=Cvel_30577 / organism=Chromera_velia_CCMP2878 / gene_product=Chromobox protein homolog 1, putative / transcript_product=Chromobox protein homolog 1, putative / location=Cvel_scaffold4379:9195-9524(+) / protein_length=110 / sequence_SO=supercontig / SO=protein_coding / is_pseudo=false